MGNLNLNNPVDFAKATLSTASNALLTLTGLQGESWDIEEAAYGHPETSASINSGAPKKSLTDILLGPSKPGLPPGLVVFHIFKSAADYGAGVASVEDTGGRRKVPFVFPYRDGQTTDDLGRKGETFDFNILLHGQNYRTVYDKLMKEFNDPRPGTLVHPVRGRLIVAVQDWTITHSNDQRNAMALRVRFTEHNFNVAFTPLSSSGKPNSFKAALTSALEFFATADRILTAIESNIFVAQSFKSTVAAAIASYNDAYSATLTNLNSTFNNGSSSDIPGLVPSNTGDNYPLAGSASDVLSAVPTTSSSGTLSSALAAQQAQDQVKALRVQLNSVIASMSTGEGAVLFYEEILDLKQSAIAVQDVLELGLQSSQARVSKYKTPRVMSIREVAFAIGFPVDDVIELELLNPQLLSVNELPKDTELTVPVKSGT